MTIAAKIKSGLKNVFNLVVRGETNAEIARKPEAVSALIDFSARWFPEASEDTTAKLRGILDRMKTTDIDFLLARGVAVGIDARLGGQNLNSDQRIDALYYSRGKEGGTLSLRPEGDGAPGDISRGAMRNLAALLRTGGVADGETYYARFITQAYNRYMVAETRWFSPKAVPSAQLKTKPELKRAPLPQPKA